MKDKTNNLTFESDNLAVPEVHTHDTKVDESNKAMDEKEKKDADEKIKNHNDILFDNLAIPEIHLKNKKKDDN